jgi:phage-related protein
LRIVVLHTCQREIAEFPLSVREDLLDAINDLFAGLSLSMPLSKKMEGMGPGVFELRFKDVSGIYRVICFLKKGEGIYLVHGFKKKSQKTPSKNLETAKLRIKRLV